MHAQQVIHFMMCMNDYHVQGVLEPLNIVSELQLLNIYSLISSGLVNCQSSHFLNWQIINGTVQYSLVRILSHTRSMNIRKSSFFLSRTKQTYKGYLIWRSQNGVCFHKYVTPNNDLRKLLVHMHITEGYIILNGVLIIDLRLFS